MPKTYLDFDLLIEKAAPGYRARVLDSPSGQTATDFSLPFSDLEMENFLLRLTRSLSEARRRIRSLESSERELVKRFGGQLFQAMFSGAVLGALQSSLNDAFQKDVGLRIRLRLTETPELAGIPWEYLFNPVANRFLSLSPDTPLIRYLDLPMPVRPLTVTPPLRVLVMISSPSDFPQLDVGAEWDRLNAALDDLAKRGLVTITRLPSASLAGLSKPLRLEKYHVLHFVGHGGFDEQAQNGALALQDAEGRARLVSGEDLGVMLSDHHSLRLVILNACEGARAASSDPFAGVAQSLVQQGIPAVIAMQFEITDEAAITFAEGLYAAIADGYPIDAALAESRRAIFASGNDVEWATPVLYTRSPNGQLFRVGKRGEEADQLAKAAAEKAEADQLAKAAAEKAEADQLAKAAAEKAEADQLAKAAAEKAEADQLAKAAAEKAEADRLAKAAAEKAEADRLAKAAKEAAEKQEAERLAKETKEAEADRLAKAAKEAAEKQEAERLAKEATQKRRIKRGAIVGVATVLLVAGVAGWLFTRSGRSGVCSTVPGSDQACLGTQLSGGYEVALTLDTFSGTDTLGPNNTLWKVKDPEAPGPKDNWDGQSWKFTPSDSTVLWTVPVERPGFTGQLETDGVFRNSGDHADCGDLPGAAVQRDFSLDDSRSDAAGITDFAGTFTIHWKCEQADAVDASFRVTGTRVG